MLETTLPDAIPYGRFSPRPDAAEAQSLLVQQDRINAYAQFAGLNLLPYITDPETSARTTRLAKREGGAELLAKLGRRKVRHVVAYRLDRLFRNVQDGLTTMDLWASQGVTLHLAAETGGALNTANATGRMMVSLLLTMSEFEASLTAERTSAGMRRKQREGQRMSKIPPYGKQPDPDNSARWIAEPSEIAQIERIMAYAAIGLGAKRIAQALNAEGLKLRGRDWHFAAVRRIVARESVVR
jgi:site-specific DNA recombinase